jgi:DNA-binding response OmpR family regulator
MLTDNGVAAVPRRRQNLVTMTQPPLSPTSAKRRALLVEDEAAIREIVKLHLSLAGYQVVEEDDGRRALDVARSTPFDLMILDVMLPGIDGITLCRSLRGDSRHAQTPILMLTARDTESDKVLGLESGADDYLTKPFGIRELMARVGAVMRRATRPETPESSLSRRVQSRELILDPDRRQAIIRDEPVELTKQEFDLVYLLATRPGIVFSREALLAKVWGGDTYVTERTVDTVVSRLRRKLERDPQDPKLILTAWGIGYKFVDVE